MRVFGTPRRIRGMGSRGRDRRNWMAATMIAAYGELGYKRKRIVIPKWLKVCVQGHGKVVEGTIEAN